LIRSSSRALKSKTSNVELSLLTQSVLAAVPMRAAGCLRFCPPRKRGSDPAEFPSTGLTAVAKQFTNEFRVPD